MQYLSDEWMDAAAEALASDEALAAATAESDLMIQYDVTKAPTGKRSYAIRLDHGTASLEAGPHPDAPVTFALEYDLAARIARGETSAQAAFMQGALKLGGDVMVLIREQASLGALDDALGELRARTTY